jgi:hypothetical protein
MKIFNDTTKTVRVFYVDSQNTFKKMPVATFNKLYFKGHKTKDLANKIVKFAICLVEMLGRKIVSIEQIEFNKIKFTQNGDVDDNFRMDMCIARLNGKNKSRNDDWTPSNEQLASLKSLLSR